MRFNCKAGWQASKNSALPGLLLALAFGLLAEGAVCRQAAAGGNEPTVDDGPAASRRGRVESLHPGIDDVSGPLPQRDRARPFGSSRFNSLEAGADGPPGFEQDRAGMRRRLRRSFNGEGSPEESNRLGGRQFGAGMRRPVGAGGFGGRSFLGGPLNFQKLGLSDEQKNTIRDLRSKNAGKARELRTALRDGRTEMRQLLFSPDATEAQIKAKRRALRQMQDQMEEMQIDDFLSMRSVLTAEQRKRLPEIMPDSGSQGRPPGMPSAAQSGPPHREMHELRGERFKERTDSLPQQPID